jgi:hypothetical protein
MTAHPTLQAAAHREPTAGPTVGDGRWTPTAIQARNPIVSLAQRFDPRPVDDARYETAIARRNTAWANYREARRRLDAVRSGDLRPYIADLNQTQHDYEHAATDLIRERVRWQAAGVPW